MEDYENLPEKSWSKNNMNYLVEEIDCIFNQGYEAVLCIGFLFDLNCETKYADGKCTQIISATPVT